MIVCVSGFACNGKTTLLKIMGGLVPSEYIVHIPQETARVALDITRSLEFSEINQNRIEVEVLTAETMWFRTARKIGLPHLFLKDRHILDVLVFMIIRKMITTDQAMDFIIDFINREKGRVCDTTILINETQDKNFISKCMEDVDRKDTLNDFFEMQEKFYKIWRYLYTTMNVELKQSFGDEEQFLEVEHPSMNPMMTMEAVAFVLNQLKENSK